MHGLGRYLSLLIAIIALLTGVLAKSLSAQGTAVPGTALQKAYDAAFVQMLEQPANLDALFRFATLAAQVGDIEGAIGALERMLLINPDLPRVRLELGVLYYRLGSFDVARAYIEEVSSTPNVPADVKSRATQFLAEIGSRQKPSRLSGEFFLGWKYQSNANLGPNTANVLLFGLTASLNQAAQGQSDWGVVSTLSLHHSYDLGRQDNAALETHFVAYANRQFQLSAANVSLIDLSTGPRVPLFPDKWQDVTIRPMGFGGAILVNDVPYYASYGAGLEAGVLLTDQLRNTSSFLIRRHDHQDNWYLPTNSLYRGIEYTGLTSFQLQLSPLLILYTNALLQRYVTEQTAYLNYTLWTAGGGMAIQFKDPAFKTGLPWGINLGIAQQWWLYDQPDPTIDPNTTRFQQDTVLSLAITIPFDQATIFSVTGGHYLRLATIPNYAFQNDSVMLGITRRF